LDVCGLVGLSEEFRNFLLIFLQDTDSEAAIFLNERMHARVVCDADENEKRVERDGSERAGGHAMNVDGARGGIVFTGDDGDAGSKVAEGLAKFDGSEWASGHFREKKR
jgi:hypothetical protein